MPMQILACLFGSYIVGLLLRRTRYLEYVQTAAMAILLIFLMETGARALAVSGMVVVGLLAAGFPTGVQIAWLKQRLKRKVDKS